MKTSKINLSHLHNEEHLQFATEFADLVKQFGAAALNIEQVFGAFVACVEQEQQALQVILKSATSQQLADADNQRDQIFRGLSDALKSALNHFDPAKHAAAVHLKIAFDQYGNIARKPYDQETAAINKLVQEAQTTYANDINLLGLSDWIAELANRNQAFDTLMKSRYTEDANKTELRMQHVRTDADASFRAIADRLDALMLINGTEAHEPFVRELNSRIEKYNNTLAQRKGRFSAAKQTAENGTVGTAKV